MLFFCNPKLRKLEAFMQEVPGFPPKGMKIDLDKLKDEIVLFKIESVFFSPKKIERKEKEKNMKFRNEQHRSAFLKEVKNQSLSNHKLLAVLYLMFLRCFSYECRKIFLVTITQQRSVALNTLPIYVERIFMFISPKIFFVSVWQRRSAAANTLPIYGGVFLCFCSQKIFFVSVRQQRSAALNTLPIFVERIFYVYFPKKSFLSVLVSSVPLHRIRSHFSVVSLTKN